VKFPPDGDAKKVDLVWTHMPNKQLKADKIYRMWHGSGIRGRPNKEWLDEIKEWCQMDVHSANILAQSRTEWRQFVKRVVDTSGH